MITLNVYKNNKNIEAQMEENEWTLHPLNHTTQLHQRKPKCPIALAVPSMPSHKRQPKKSRYRKRKDENSTKETTSSMMMGI